MKNRILLFIPGYNCEEQIIRVLNQLDKKVMSYITEVIFVNNRSTDNTEQVVLNFKKENKNFPIKVLRNDSNYNLGGSHKVAFKYAIENKFDYVIILHGDDQGEIHDLLPLLKKKEYKKYDCLLGSRFMKGSKIQGYSLFRQFGNRVFNIIFSICLFKKITDLGAGLNMYSTDMLKSNFYHKYPDRLTFNCYMLLATNAYNQKIKFFPISWREDDQVSNVKMFSQSKQTLALVLRYFFQRKKYLEKDHRDKIIESYTAKEIKKINRSKESSDE